MRLSADIKGYDGLEEAFRAESAAFKVTRLQVVCACGQKPGGRGERTNLLFGVAEECMLQCTLC